MTNKGLEIDGAKKDGPAGKAGLQKGDIIISIDGKPVKNIYDYMYRLAELKPGRAVDVIIKRGEEELTIKVNL
jgi:S1-C subfamily serine protease